jgi:Domain of unknown function (DUF4124)
MPHHVIDRLKWFVLWLVCLLATLSFVDRVRAADQIYFFVDDHGVTHLSNLPTDPRYRATGVTTVQTASASIDSAPSAESEPAALPTGDDIPPGPGQRMFTPLTITPHPLEER